MATKRKPPKRGQAKSASKYALKYFLVADDVRTERTNKLIIIGFYGGAIRVPRPGIQTPTLSVVFCVVRRTDTAPTTATFSLMAPGGEPVFPETTFQAADRDKSTNHNFIFRAAGVTLNPGTYTALLVLDETETFEGTFDVEVDPDLIKRTDV